MRDQQGTDEMVSLRVCIASCGFSNFDRWHCANGTGFFSVRLLAAAFSRVFGSKQSGHVAIHRWLQDQVAAATPRNEREACRLREVARAGNVLYRGYRY